MDQQRLIDWAEAIEAAVERALRDVVATYPFEPAEHTVGPPASEPDLAALRQRLPWIPDDLLAVARWVGAVSLPDIANGYFMFSSSYIQGVLYHDDGIPDRIGEPFDEDVDVVIFGADGGGTLYALAVGDVGTVYRLRECGYEQGVYSSYAGFGVTVVAEDLDDFLDLLLAAVAASPSTAASPTSESIGRARSTVGPTCGASDRVTGGVGAGMTAGRPMPTQDDVLGYFDTLSNWGRWGDDDELGTLNHITDDVRVAAARAVRHGRSVSCAWEVAVPEEMERSTTTCPCAADMPGAENMPVPAFHADRRWGFSSERLGITFHGNTLTHVDSPCHIFWDGTMYNGRPHSLVDAATGAAWAAVTAAANGIITRGVLLDIARVRDVPWLEPGQGVFPDDLEEAERRQGVRVRPGDAVLLRTGYGRRRHEAGAAGGFTQAGWHASCLPWLHERQVALIGADTPQDVQPSGYEDVLMPVHAVSLVAMGLWLLDNCDLEACATTAAELGQWDFHLAVAPIRFAGTSGSPVNPIATF
ncbi:cyclase family protein [Dactylosporangium sp. NPDC005572]|uniref:cyclase family protein n=1 Tax=Dactylosporangium sp. NPDC005572 TaxID=3156889 RepID=UPI0033BA020A